MSNEAKDQTQLSDGPSVVSQLDDLAIRLAESHGLSPHPRHQPSLLDRLWKWASLLRDAYDHFRQMPDTQRAPSYTAEWLLDNFYVLQQALRQVREDFVILVVGGEGRQLERHRKRVAEAGLERHLVFAGLIILVLAEFVYGLATTTTFIDRPFPGFVVLEKNLVPTVTMPGWPGYEAGIRFGDIVTLSPVPRRSISTVHRALADDQQARLTAWP